MSYAESIQREHAAVFQGECGLPLGPCVDHINVCLADGRARQHTTYDKAGEPLVNRAFRDSRSVVPAHEDELAFFMFESVQRYFDANFDRRASDALVLTQTEFFAYDTGPGLQLHADDHATLPDGTRVKTDTHRGITSILYLNSDFTGGELDFPKQVLSIRPRQGLLVIFPSNGRFPHAVRPVAAGRRLSFQRIFGVMNGDRQSFDAR